MQWNCPHCGVSLNLKDQELGTDWSFSKCAQCSSFALVKKIEISVLKVDRAPEGERILLPERTTEEQVIASVPEPPALAPSPVQPPPFHAPPPPPPQIAVLPPPSVSAPIIPAPLPRLPDLPERHGSWFENFLMGAIFFAALATIGSGSYLYSQARMIWKKSHLHSASAHPSSESISKNSAVSSIEPHEITDQVKNESMAPLRSTSHSQIIPQVIRKALNNHQLSALTIRPGSSFVELRAGPGSHYEKLGTAHFLQNYVVTDWSNNWLKVLTAEGKVAWLKTDEVQIIPLQEHISKEESTLPNSPTDGHRAFPMADKKPH